MPLERSQDRILLKHPKVGPPLSELHDRLIEQCRMNFKGSSVEILFYGATVISWKSATAQNTNLVERLFVSSKASLDGSKPVRGGIPVVFPNFGAPSHPEHLKLGQHGFARGEIWQWGGLVMDNDAGVSVRLSMSDLG
jgi:glucose-6-phosphate 1-epimerase